MTGSDRSSTYAKIRFLALALLLGVLGGTAAADPLLVFAASSLTEALTQIGSDFERAGRARVIFSFGATSDLARQIRAGAPADLFVSADTAQLDSLVAGGQVRSTAVVRLLSNTLAVVVPAGTAQPPRKPADLIRLKRIAVADPAAVPAGLYARDYLEQAGLWSRLGERLVPMLDVRAALAAVETGAVDAGIVYRTDARTSERVAVAFEVAREHGPEIVYCAALLAGARHRAAPTFLRYLRSRTARVVFERYGFVVLVEPGGAHR